MFKKGVNRSLSLYVCHVYLDQTIVMHNIRHMFHRTNKKNEAIAANICLFGLKKNFWSYSKNEKQMGIKLGIKFKTKIC